LPMRNFFNCLFFISMLICVMTQHKNYNISQLKRILLYNLFSALNKDCAVQKVSGQGFNDADFRPLHKLESSLEGIQFIVQELGFWLRFV